MSDFFKGAFCVFRGIACFYKDRSLWKYALKAWGIILIVYIAVLRLIFYLAGVLANYWNARLADYPVFLQKLLSGSLTFAALLFSVLLILTTVSTFFEATGAFFFDALTEDFEKKNYHTVFKKIPFKTQLSFVFQAAAYGFNTFILLLLLLIGGLFLPLAGQVLLVILMGVRMGYSLVFSPGFLRGQSTEETIAFFRSKRLALAGFGICVYLLFLLPFSLPFLLPGAVLGGSILYNRDF